MNTEEEELDGYTFQRGGHWEPEYIQTILQWIHICAINVDVMTESAAHYRKLLRRQTIISLLLTSLASTSSLSQFGIHTESDATLQFALNIAFTAMSLIVALSTGFIKVYQIQEKLEQSIKLQQEWTALGSVLSSELQLPIPLRKDALLIIVKYKDVYLELFKQQTDTSMSIMNRIAKKYGLESYADLSLSELFERILWLERRRIIGIDVGNVGHQIDTMPTIPIKPNQIAPNQIAPTEIGLRSVDHVDKFLMMVKLKSKHMPTPELNGRRKIISQLVMDQSASESLRTRKPIVSNPTRIQIAEIVDAGLTPHVRLPPIQSKLERDTLQKKIQELEKTSIPTPEKAERIQEIQQAIQNLDDIIEIEESASRED